MTAPGTAAIIPFKELGSAKQRLTSVLTPHERRTLALAMLQDVLELCADLPNLEALFIVTADDRAASLARGHGAQQLAEKSSTGINAAVELGLAAVTREGFARALVIPADVPLATKGEMTRLLQPGAIAGAPRIVIAPSRDGDGTNGLLMPADISLRPSYGSGSFLRHLSLAVASRCNVEVLTLAGLGWDIDTPADLYNLRTARAMSTRYKFLASASSNAHQEIMRHDG